MSYRSNMRCISTLRKWNGLLRGLWNISFYSFVLIKKNSCNLVSGGTFTFKKIAGEKYLIEILKNESKYFNVNLKWRPFLQNEMHNPLPSTRQLGIELHCTYVNLSPQQEGNDIRDTKITKVLAQNSSVKKE